MIREGRLPVPPDALREILLSAVMHRDYADPARSVVKYGMAPPTFEEQAGAMFVTFRALIGLGADARHQVGTKSALSEQQARALQAAGLSIRAEAVMHILSEHGPLGSPDILRELGEPITQRALQADIRRLQDAGLVVASGKGRAATYRVVESP